MDMVTKMGVVSAKMGVIKEKVGVEVVPTFHLRKLTPMPPNKQTNKQIFVPKNAFRGEGTHENNV